MPEPNEALSRGELLEQIAALARSYTPEWRFTARNPDAGSVIAMIFASQLAENLERYRALLGGLRAEFVSLLGLSPAPASPASGTAVFSLAQDTLSGSFLPAGTKLLGGEDCAVFETQDSVYVTNAKISALFSVSQKRGKIIPLCGGAGKIPFLPLDNAQPPLVEDLEEIPPFRLFDFSAQGISENALLLFHPYLFHVPEGAALHLCADGADSARLADSGEFEWLYYNGERFAPFDEVQYEHGEVLLIRSGTPGVCGEDGCACIAVRARGPVLTPLYARGLRFSSSCESIAPDFVCHNDEQVHPEGFLPFGETAALYDECYIGCGRAFSQRGAAVTLSFSLSFRERLAAFPAPQDADDLRIIKRRPPAATPVTAQSAPEQVVFEYFNGRGWNRLPAEEDWSGIFSGAAQGGAALRFRCPDDLAPASAGGFEGACIRMRITRADNCYYQPCVHRMPFISNLRISYSYGTHSLPPKRTERIFGTQRADLTGTLTRGAQTALFTPQELPGDRLLCCFDRPIEHAPAALYFALADTGKPLSVRFSYSGADGFFPLRTEDGTGGFSRSGAVRFEPPAGWKRAAYCGVSGWWLSVELTEPAHPVAVSRLLLNAADIRNIETLPEQLFYVDTARAGMEFSLGEGNLLSAEVFVSELPRLTAAQIAALIRDHPEDVRLETARSGAATECLVRWREADSFDESGPDSRHFLLDRTRGVICFGDGTHGMLPPAQSGPAVRVVPRRCAGSAGNLPADAVGTPLANLPFIGKIYNPAPTAGGQDMESAEMACRRGGALLSARRRLVSELDFERAAVYFSKAVFRARCLSGINAQGEPDPRAVTVAVLLRDWERGDLFAEICGRIREEMLSRCEPSLNCANFSVTAPHYVEISVRVQLAAMRMEQAFEIQREVSERIAAFLHPITGNRGTGWMFGRMPTASQISAVLRAGNGEYRAGQAVITARMRGFDCRAETDRRDWHADPLAVCVSGTHQIDVTTEGGGPL